MNQKRNQNFENTLLKQTLLFCFVLSQCMSHLGLNLNKIPLILYYPPCIPSPYSVPPHAYPPPILSQLIHTLPPFYFTPYMPSPYSIPLYACPLLFSTSPHMPPQYSIAAHACPPNSLCMKLEGMFLLWHLRMQFLNLLTSAHTT